MLTIFLATAAIDVECFLTVTIVCVLWMCNEEVIFVHFSDCRSVFQVTQRNHIKFGMAGLKPALEISFLNLLDS